VQSDPSGGDGAGPIAPARRWITAVMADGDWDEAWLLTDDVLRLTHVQAWLWAHRDDAELSDEDLDELAASVCEDGPAHPLWDDFSELVLLTYHQTWQEFDLDRWKVDTSPRPVAPDLEVVVFTREEEQIIATDQRFYVVRPFLMHLTDAGWKVAHAGSDQLPIPGWPPEFPSPTTQG
jgi:hypothetical protein